MLVSTRGRYALRVMIDLAEHTNPDNSAEAEYIPLADIAKRQGISEKYLESIIGVLSKSGSLYSLRGKRGGYRLSGKPEEYTVADILKQTEGSFAPVACLESDHNDCPHTCDCRTLEMWEHLYKIVGEYLESVTIADLMKK